jgi:methylated-DNA-[protein]-cysteine S-methyltransferase
MTTVHTTWTSPLGPITLVGDDGRLCGLYFETRRHAPTVDTFGPRDDEPFRAVVEQLAAYFAGERVAFDVALAPAGTPFQRLVWSALRDIPYGETMTYAQLAAQIGRPAAVRAVGAANGRNPVSVIVPCHRVIGSDGGLTDYGGGLDRKERLLRLEGAWA